jgi:RNA polymerase sigma-32 factor
VTDTPEKPEPDGSDEPEGIDTAVVEAGTAPVPLPVAATGAEVTATDPLSRYFVEISRYALLSREEEKALAVRAHDHGDAEAAQQLALANLRLVVKIAMDYRRVWTNVLDLIQEGNLGLLQGVQRFDPHRGVKLSSYAAYWIRAYILKYLIDNIRLVRMGSSRAERKLFFQLNRARRELERAGFAAEPKLLAEKLDVKESEVIDMERRLSQSDLSIDAPTSDESGSATFGDFLASPGASVESLVADEDMRATFREIVDAFAVDLDERGQQILRERVLADEPRTLQAIGDDLGVTRERVRQLEKKLVDQLREYLRENLVDFDYWAPDS